MRPTQRSMLFLILTCFLFLSTPIKAETPKKKTTEGKIKPYIAEVKKDVKNIWENGGWDLYVPFVTWHARFMYDYDKTRSYNENPWGLGLGKHVYDGDIYKGIYAMNFKDSHHKNEPIIGYVKQWNHYFDRDNNFSAGAGYTIGVTFRDDYDYLPIPLILPIVGIQYGKVAIQATYIPGPYNMFNVFFAWMRIEF